MTENHEQKQSGLLFVCIEGIAGAGKSTLLRAIHEELTRRNLSSTVFKLGGLGDSRWAARLKAIRASRQDIMERGDETLKQTADRLRGRIYHIALQAQLRELKSLLAKESDAIYLLDRTPLTNSVRLQAEVAITNIANPYIPEIRAYELSVIKELNMTDIIFLDVSTETSLARMIVRYFGDNAQGIEAAIRGLNAPSKRKRIVHQRVRYILQSSKHIARREIDNWHLAVPIELIDAERTEFKRVLRSAKSTCQSHITILNAEQPIEETLDHIAQLISKRIASGNSAD